MVVASDVIDAALAELGVKRFLLAIHDVSFPSDPDEDLGRGAPTTKAAARLFAYARSLGFTGVQLGPQGQTSKFNPSPYDSTIFSRHLATIPMSTFRPLVDDVERHLTNTVDHRHAFDASRALVVAAFARIDDMPDLRHRMHEFIRQHGEQWLRKDIEVALVGPTRQHDGWDDPFQYAFGQMLAHEAHARLREVVGEIGLSIYGDLQVGYSVGDAWAYKDAFLGDYLMGAPPSRTNPDGQAWNYPVLDPEGDAARALLVARIDKAFAEYDAFRIDHPHGLVCPWVYRANTADPNVAVRDGARLFESPDVSGLPPIARPASLARPFEHADLARYAIARADQLDRTKPPYHDAWVRELDDDQVALYSRNFDVLADCAKRHGRAMADVSCEVLSTMPLPLQRVLERHGLGRWRVTQKANLDDATDVYRTENAQRADWVMLGNHDTAPIFALIRSWSPEVRAKWARHLSARLAPPASISPASISASREPQIRNAIVGDARWDDDGFVAAAMLAELFVCEAENVSIFWADLFGVTERFNVPGTISDANWSVRLPPDFEQLHRDRLTHHRALDLRLSLKLALQARGSTSGIAEALETTTFSD